MPRPQVDTRPYISEWQLTSRPGNNGQATVTEAAPAAGRRAVLTGLMATIANAATAPAASNVALNVIDGGTGGTTYLLRLSMSTPAVAGQTTLVSLNRLNIAATAATALTVEFSGGSGTDTDQSLSAWGYTTSD